MKTLIILLSLIIYATIFPNTVRADYQTKAELVTLAKRVHAADIKTAQLRQFNTRVARVAGFLQSHQSPLAASAKSFVVCGDRFGINPGLLVGITNAESTLGKYYNLLNNPFNYAVHLNLSFPTMEEAACHVAEKLKTQYDTSSIYSIAIRYAPKSDHNDPEHWAGVVANTQREIGI